MVASEVSGSRQESPAASVAHAPQAPTSRFDENTPTTKLVMEVVKRSIPLGLASVAQISIGTMLVAMVGNMVGDKALGATSLACGLLNATAFSFAAGFCGALETVLSHSYGRDPNSKLYGVYGQRMAMMLLVIAAGVGPILAFSDSLLIAIGQNVETALLVGRFCRITLFGVYAVMLLEMMRRYFACQHLNKPLSVNLIGGAVSFPFVLWASIKMFGFEGSAIAWVFLMCCMPASLFIYLFVTGKYKKTWGGWDPTALTNWRPLLRLAFPSMAMMMSEWMSLEINLIVAGFAPDNDLSAFSIVYQCSGIMWSLASGVFIESAVLVGNALGQGKPQFARRCAIICLFCAMGFAVLNLTVLLVFRNYIPRLFSRSAEVHATYRRLLPFFVCYHFFDCVQSCMMGILRGCGLQTLGALAIACVYSVVGVPVGAVLFFRTSIGIRSLWFGPAFGVTVVGFPLYMYLFKFYIKWDNLERREDEIPSLNTSMDERSMRAYTGTPPPSLTPSDDEDGSSSSVGDRADGSGGGRSRRHSHHDLQGLPRRHTPNSMYPTSASGAAGGNAVDNSSFTSINTFMIPQRSILSAQPFFASSTPSEPHPPAVLANAEHDDDDGQDSANCGDGATAVPAVVSKAVGAEAKTAYPRHTKRTNVGDDHSRSGDSSHGPYTPLSSATSSTPSAGPRRAARSPSASSRDSRGPQDGQRTNLPSSSSSDHHSDLST